MSNNPSIKVQPLQTTSILLLLSKFIERAGFYGLRVLLIIHLVGESIQMNRDEALKIMGLFTVVISVAAILGGWIGDRFLNNRNTAIFGNILQMLGAFISCLPSSNAMYIGIFLIGLGTGAYTSNLFAYFGNLFRDKEDRIDSGFTGLYLFVNLGSFLGVLLSSYLYEIEPIYAFLFAGVLFLVSSILIWIARSPKTLKISEYNGIQIAERRKRILLFITISSIFWWAYNFGSEGSFEAMELLIFRGESIIPESMLYSLGSYFIIVFGIAATIIWYLIRISRATKLITGSAIAALSFTLLLAMNSTQSSNLILYILVFALFSIAELLVAPTIHALIVLYLNPKYLATIYGFLSLPSRLLIYISGTVFLNVWQNPTTGLVIGLVLFLLCATIVVLLKDKFKAIYHVSSEIDEIGIKNSNF